MSATQRVRAFLNLWPMGRTNHPDDIYILNAHGLAYVLRKSDILQALDEAATEVLLDIAGATIKFTDYDKFRAWLADRMGK